MLSDLALIIYIYAARGGLKRKPFAWGDELTPNGTHRMNIWQGSSSFYFLCRLLLAFSSLLSLFADIHAGTFPDINTLEDGHFGPAPVRTYQPNAHPFVLTSLYRTSLHYLLSLFDFKIDTDCIIWQATYGSGAQIGSKWHIP